MEIEIWKDVFGYDGRYQVSNLARVKSVARFRPQPRGCKRWMAERIKFCLLNKRLGYYQVKLCKEGTPKTCKVHRLLAIAFIPNPENKPQINHINGIRSDNRLENLEWCTASENSLHHYRVLKHKSVRGSKNHLCRLTYSRVKAIRKAYSERKISVIAIARKFHVSITCPRKLARLDDEHIELYRKTA